MSQVAEHLPIIVGAGIAGLTLGLALQQQGIGVDIYEGAERLDPIGAGIWMAPNAMQVFDRLGLTSDIVAAGTEVERVSILTSDLDVIKSVEQSDVKKKFGFKIVAIPRADLHRILLDHFDRDRLHLGKRLATIEDVWDGPKAVFEDGSSASGPFLIGADGINSVARRTTFGAQKVRRTGQTCWRGLLRFDLPLQFQRCTSEMWNGISRMGVADVGCGHVYWFLVDSSQDHQLGAKEPVTHKAAVNCI